MDREPFDDVRYQFVEEPEPPRPRRPLRARRWALGGAAALVLACGVTGGASALSATPSRSKAAQERSLPHKLNLLTHGWHDCHHAQSSAAGVPPAGPE